MGAAVPIITALTGLGSAAAGFETARKAESQAEEARKRAEAQAKVQAEQLEKLEKPKVEAETPEEIAKRRKRQRTKTRLTGPRGLLTEAPVAQKTLLGE